MEVSSPGDRRGEIDERVADYLRAGTPLVWLIDPATRTIVLHAPDAAARTLAEHDVLDGGDVLPGFRVPVSEVFRDLKREAT